MSYLTEQAIQELYDDPLEVSELQEAGRCLLEVFELLIEVDSEQKQKKKDEINE